MKRLLIPLLIPIAFIAIAGGLWGGKRWLEWRLSQGLELGDCRLRMPGIGIGWTLAFHSDSAYARCGDGLHAATGRVRGSFRPFPPGPETWGLLRARIDEGKLALSVGGLEKPRAKGLRFLPSLPIGFALRLDRLAIATSSGKLAVLRGFTLSYMGARDLRLSAMRAESPAWAPLRPSLAAHALRSDSGARIEARAWAEADSLSLMGRLRSRPPYKGKFQFDLTAGPEGPLLQSLGSGRAGVRPERLIAHGRLNLEWDAGPAARLTGSGSFALSDSHKRGVSRKDGESMLRARVTRFRLKPRLRSAPPELAFTVRTENGSRFRLEAAGEGRGRPGWSGGFTGRIEAGEPWLQALAESRLPWRFPDGKERSRKAGIGAIGFQGSFRDTVARLSLHVNRVRFPPFRADSLIARFRLSPGDYRMASARIYRGADRWPAEGRVLRDAGGFRYRFRTGNGRLGTLIWTGRPGGAQRLRSDGLRLDRLPWDRRAAAWSRVRYAAGIPMRLWGSLRWGDPDAGGQGRWRLRTARAPDASASGNLRWTRDSLFLANVSVEMGGGGLEIAAASPRQDGHILGESGSAHATLTARRFPMGMALSLVAPGNPIQGGRLSGRLTIRPGPDLRGDLALDSLEAPAMDLETLRVHARGQALELHGALAPRFPAAPGVAFRGRVEGISEDTARWNLRARTGMGAAARLQGGLALPKSLWGTFEVSSNPFNTPGDVGIASRRTWGRFILQTKGMAGIRGGLTADSGRFAWAPGSEIALRGLRSNFAWEQGRLSASGRCENCRLEYDDASVSAALSASDVRAGYFRSSPSVPSSRGTLRPPPVAADTLRISLSLDSSRVRLRGKDFGGLPEWFAPTGNGPDSPSAHPRLEADIRTGSGSQRLQSRMLSLSYRMDLHVRGRPGRLRTEGFIAADTGRFGLPDHPYALDSLRIRWRDVPFREGTVSMGASKNLAVDCRPGNQDSCRFGLRLSGSFASPRFAFASACVPPMPAGFDLDGLISSVAKECRQPGYYVDGADSTYGDRVLAFFRSVASLPAPGGPGDPGSGESRNRGLGGSGAGNGAAAASASTMLPSPTANGREAWIESDGLMTALEASTDPVARARALDTRSPRFRMGFRFRAQSDYRPSPAGWSHPWRRIASMEWYPAAWKPSPRGTEPGPIRRAVFLEAAVAGEPPSPDPWPGEGSRSWIGISAGFEFWGAPGKKTVE